MSIIQGQPIYQTTSGTFLPVAMSSPPAQAQIVPTVAVPTMHGYHSSSMFLNILYSLMHLSVATSVVKWLIEFV